MTNETLCEKVQKKKKNHFCARKWLFLLIMTILSLGKLITESAAEDNCALEAKNTREGSGSSLISRKMNHTGKLPFHCQRSKFRSVRTSERNEDLKFTFILILPCRYQQLKG